MDALAALESLLSATIDSQAPLTPPSPQDADFGGGAGLPQAEPVDQTHCTCLHGMQRNRI